jgi:hypothetical protein
MSLETLQANLTQPRLCPNPIFVIGSPRSGTHGLAFALGTHSQLWTHSESEILAPLFGNDPVEDIIQEANKRVLPTWLRMYQVSKAELYGFLGIGLNALFTSRNPEKRWIDKTPQYALMGEVLAAMFPGARFLHIVRDGRRVVHSMSRFLARFSPASREAILKSGHLASWSTDFRAACRTWREYTEAATRFCAAHPERCLTVINEQLVSDPERGFAEIGRFLDIAPEKGPIEFFRGYRVNSSFQEAPPDLPSAENLSRPFRQWSLDQSQYFLDPKPHRDRAGWKDWPTEWREQFIAEAGETMVRLGFASGEELLAWRDAPAAETTKASPQNAETRSFDRLLQDVVADALPPEAVVLVVTSSASEVPKLADRLTFRFPLVYMPADSDQAITHLESLRQKGAGYLLFPSTEFWWFERYAEFLRHLDTKGRCVWNDSCCRIYQLG